MEYLTDEDYEVAKKNGISKKLAYQRFYFQNFSKRRAITQPVSISHSKEFLYLAKQNGVHYETYTKRVRKGIPPEIACQKGRIKA